MLMALGLKMPLKVFGHGWWTVEGQKMSKSKGNVVDPIALAKEFGVDAVRFFLLREVQFGSDGDFSRDSLIHRFNSDLANDMGNLLNRSLTMIEKYFEGNVPQIVKADFDEVSADLVNLAKETPSIYSASMDKVDFSPALDCIWELVNAANTYIEKEAPWKHSKEGRTHELKAVMHNLAEVLRITAILIYPFMPATAEEMWKQLGFSDPLAKSSPDASFGKNIAVKVNKGNPLFPRIETK
jgi:methionyl-tRNA synthetase